MKLRAARPEDAGRIAGIIGNDPGLSATLLRLANSPLYALSRPIDSLARGVMRIGAGELAQLALGVAVADRFLRAARDHAGTGVQRQHAARRPHPLRQARRQRPRAAAGLVDPLAAQIAQAPAQAFEPGLVLRLERQRVVLAGQGIEKGFAIHDGRG